MSLQIRPSAGPGAPGTGPLYSPHRDLAYLYPNAVQTAEEFLMKGQEPWLADLLEERGITEEDLANAVESFCKMLNAASNDPDESMLDVLKSSGFLDVAPEARFALLAYLGQIMAACAFRGLRDVTKMIDGQPHAPDCLQQLIHTGLEMNRYLALGPVGRWWYRLRRRRLPRAYNFVTG